MTPREFIHTLRGQEVGLSIVLAIQGTIMFVIAPLAATGVVAVGFLDVCRVALAGAAVLLLTRNRMAARAIGGAFILSAVLSALADHGVMAEEAGYVRQIATAVFDLSVAAMVAQTAFAPGRVTVHRIMGAVILYLSIGLLFANAYRACAMALHPSFNGLTDGRGAGISQLLYFSLTTLTTTGYGDIIPVHPFVRSLANLEAVIGQLFPATLLARLVTLHASGARFAETVDRVRGDDT